MPKYFQFGLLKLQRPYQMPKLIWITFVFFLNSCAFSEMVFPGLTQRSVSKEKKSLIYYVGANRLNLYSQPNSTSKIIARLPLHQKVMRSNLDNGFAYVTVAENSLKGWVDNAQLIWKLPTRTNPAKVDKIPSNTGSSEPKIIEKPTSTEAVVPAEPQETNAVTGSQPTTIPPSIFNPF